MLLLARLPIPVVPLSTIVTSWERTYFLRMLMNSFSREESSLLISVAAVVGGVDKFGVVGLVMGVTVPEEGAAEAILARVVARKLQLLLEAVGIELLYAGGRL